MFRCKKCKGEIVPTDSLNSTQVHVGEDTFEAVSTFQYLGDVLGELGGCVDATSICITVAWKAIRHLLPIITNRCILLRNWGNFFTSCIRKSLPYGCKTWPTSNETIRRLISADNGMVCWICGVRLEQCIRTQELHEKFSIISIPEEIDGAGLDTLATSREWIQITWYLGFSPEAVRNFVGEILSQRTSKISTSGNNLLTIE